MLRYRQRWSLVCVAVGLVACEADPDLSEVNRDAGDVRTDAGRDVPVDMEIDVSADVPNLDDSPAGYVRAGAPFRGRDPGLAFDSQDRLVLASIGSDSVSVQRLSGGQWGSLGTIALNITGSGTKLVVSGEDQPVVAASFATRGLLGCFAYWSVWRLKMGVWEPGPYPGCSLSQLMADRAGRVMSLMTNSPGLDEVQVVEGTTWTPVTTVPHAPGARRDFAANAVGVMEAIWLDNGPHRRRWVNGSWESRDPPPGLAASTYVRVALNDAGTTAFAWLETEGQPSGTPVVFVEGWAEPRRLTHLPRQDLPRLFIDGQGRPIVDWRDKATSSVALDRWNGDRWQTIGPFKGVVSPQAAPGVVAVALDSEDRPAIALEQDQFVHVFVPEP
jgi:hypothetical protein